MKSFGIGLARRSVKPFFFLLLLSSDFLLLPLKEGQTPKKVYRLLLKSRHCTTLLKAEVTLTKIAHRFDYHAFFLGGLKQLGMLRLQLIIQPSIQSFLNLFQVVIPLSNCNNSELKVLKIWHPIASV